MKASFIPSGNHSKLIIHSVNRKSDQLCENEQKQFWQSPLWWLVVYSGSKQGKILTRLANLVAQIGRAASLIPIANKLGIVLVLIVAPAASSLHGFISPEYMARPDWYFYSPYYYVLGIDDYLAGSIICVGSFLLFTPANRLRWIAIAPLAYYLSQLIFKSLATSNEQFNGNVPASLLVLSIIIGIVILKVADQLLYKYNHGKVVTIRKNIEGIWNIPDSKLSLQEKVALSKRLASEVSINNEIY